MTIFVPRHKVLICLLTVLATFFASGMTSPTRAQESHPDTRWEQPLLVPSPEESNSWFPDLAVDSKGHAHIVWCETSDRVEAELEEGWERAYYAMWDGASWTNPNDIVPPTEPIIRHAIAVDRNDVLHLTYRYFIPGHFTGIYYSQTPAESAWSAASWAEPRMISARGRNYDTGLAVARDGTIHVIFDDEGDEDYDACPSCADIFYRQSTDNGQHWSPPRNLSRSPLGSSREQIQLDSSGTIHVTWDEGWDRLSGRGDPIYSNYTFSTDQGLTWHQPITIASPITGTAQLAVGADDEGGVMLVWRVTSRAMDEHNGIYYQWSADGGISWSEPEAIPAIYARPWESPFDRYDLDTDSAGQIHLVAVGQQSQEWEAPVGLFHLVWNGETWSAPEEIYQEDDRAPEYPGILIARGNRLNVTWFTRPDDREGAYEVWYRKGRTDAPYQTPVPIQTPTVPATRERMDAQVTPEVENPTPFSTLEPVTTPSPDNLYTEYDEVLKLALGVSPILLIVALVWLFRRRR